MPNKKRSSIQIQCDDGKQQNNIKKSKYIFTRVGTEGMGAEIRYVDAERTVSRRNQKANKFQWNAEKAYLITLEKSTLYRKTPGRACLAIGENSYSPEQSTQRIKKW